MDLKTKPFQAGINFLCNISDTQIFKESFSLYTEDGCLWGNTIRKDNKLMIRVKLAEKVSESFKAVLHTKDVKAAVDRFDEETFIFNVNDKAIEIAARISTTLTMFSKEATHIRMSGLNLGTKFGDVSSPFTEDDLELFKSYLDFVTGPADEHPFVYVKDEAMATDKNILRKSKKNFCLPYLIGLNDSMIKLFSGFGDNYLMEFYDVGYKVTSCTDGKPNDWFTIVATKPAAVHLNRYEEMKDFSNLPVPETSFKFNRENMTVALKDLKQFVPADNQSLRLDIICGRIMVGSDADTKKARATMSFDTNADFTYKKVPYAKFLSLLSRGDEIVTVHTSATPYPEDPKDTSAFLRIDDSAETVIIAPIKGD